MVNFQITPIYRAGFASALLRALIARCINIYIRPGDCYEFFKRRVIGFISDRGNEDWSD